MYAIALGTIIAIVFAVTGVACLGVTLYHILTPPKSYICLAFIGFLICGHAVSAFETIALFHRITIKFANMLSIFFLEVCLYFFTTMAVLFVVDILVYWTSSPAFFMFNLLGFVTSLITVLSLALFFRLHGIHSRLYDLPVELIRIVFTPYQ
ncbi:hypothetical protein CEXT_338571 [Caerostris extrusa]|uniref:NADH dehydrogenase subunit 6 n=1 Tax=Caerostris extrusa TaxID=172846 RepID=A0AAV4PB39_CAEEX|nr:hypothetical protein CEXT_338571 [Caerostris extrusa]